MTSNLIAHVSIITLIPSIATLNPFFIYQRSGDAFLWGIIILGGSGFMFELVLILAILAIPLQLLLIIITLFLWNILGTVQLIYGVPSISVSIPFALGAQIATILLYLSLIKTSKTHASGAVDEQNGSPTLMVRLWHRLERLWYGLRWVRLVVLGLVLCTAVLAGQQVIPMISRGLLFDFAQHQKGNFEQQTGAYLDRLSAAILPALVRRDARELSDALDRAQGDRYPGLKPLCAIVELPDGTFFASSDPDGFVTQQALHKILRLGFQGGDGIGIAGSGDRAWLVRTLRAEGFPVGRLFANVDITGFSPRSSIAFLPRNPFGVPWCESCCT